MQKWEYLGMYHKAVRDAHGRKAGSLLLDGSNGKKKNRLIPAFSG